MMKKIQIQDTMKLVKYSLKIKPVLVCIALATLVTSCQDFLDVEPENSLTQQEFWKTKSDVMSVVAATYNAARDNTEKSFLMGEVRADFITVAAGDYHDIGLHNISTSNSVANWYNYYNVINLANTVNYFAPIVQQDLDKTLTQPIVNQIKSEMLFLRSLSYFYLVRIWKDVPLVLRPTISDSVEFYVPKSTEAVVLKQLVTDLELANTLASTDATVKGRANKYAIQALLADVFLWKEDYQHCKDYCDSIISSGKFSLEPNLTWFNLYYPGNSLSESIFEIQYNDQLDQEENPLYTTYSTMTVRIDNMAFGLDNDIRKCWPTVNAEKGPKWKYIGKDATGSTTQKRASGEYDANYIYYRYADVLLMKAEAIAEMGDQNLPEANDLVEQIALRAGRVYEDTYSLPDFRTALLAERGREFGAEGKRWFDLLRVAKRNGFAEKQFLIDIMVQKATNAKELIQLKPKVLDSMSYFLPIHKDQIKYNKNLVQNPFYDR
jgi:hypothetical protein